MSKNLFVVLVLVVLVLVVLVLVNPTGPKPGQIAIPNPKKGWGFLRANTVWVTPTKAPPQALAAPPATTTKYFNSDGGSTTITTTQELVDEPVWSDADAFDSTAAEYPLGDSTVWTYWQSWDGIDTNTTIHVALAPNLVCRVVHHIGTRWEIRGTLPKERLAEMVKEIEARDNLSGIPLVIIDSVDDPNATDLPDSWSIETFPAK